jgi:hypothetical protein
LIDRVGTANGDRFNRIEGLPDCPCITPIDARVERRRSIAVTEV